MSPQPGKVNTQVSTMSRTTPKFIALMRFTAPTPMMALVLVCVVLTGMPPTLESRRQKAAERSAEKPWYFSSLTMSMPTDLIIFSPPTLVPRPMTSEHMSISQTGICIAAHVALPVAEGEAKEEHADELLAVLRAVHEAHGRRAAICAHLKKGCVFRRSAFSKASVTSLQSTQPLAKPSARLSTRP